MKLGFQVMKLTELQSSWTIFGRGFKISLKLSLTNYQTLINLMKNFTYFYIHKRFISYLYYDTDIKFCFTSFLDDFYQL